MQTRLLSVFAGLALLVGGQQARADTISLHLDSVTPAQAHITFNGSSEAVTPGPYFWSTTTTPINSVSTFCVQLDSFIQVGQTYTFQKTSLASAPTIGNQTKADYITELFGRYYNTAWSNPSFTGSTQATAFQLALWELVYDGPTDASSKGSLDLSSGTFKDTSSSDSSAVSLAQKYLNGGSGYTALSGDTSQFTKNFGGYQLLGLSPSSGQGQVVNGVQGQVVLVNTVPAPPGVFLAGAGLIALVGRGRFLRRKPTAAA
jgi:hypothetical protein